MCLFAFVFNLFYPLYILDASILFAMHVSMFSFATCCFEVNVFEFLASRWFVVALSIRFSCISHTILHTLQNTFTNLFSVSSLCQSNLCM